MSFLLTKVHIKKEQQMNGGVDPDTINKQTNPALYFSHCQAIRQNSPPCEQYPPLKFIGMCYGCEELKQELFIFALNVTVHVGKLLKTGAPDVQVVELLLVIVCSRG